MPVKIRLARRGRKKSPYYHIVAADSRAPRDGRYIEKLGIYDPKTNPATIELDFDKSLEWLVKGAQPTDTCRAILSYKGVLYKKHLLTGVKKNAFSLEEAERKFAEWMTMKESKIQSKIDSVKKSSQMKAEENLKEESKKREVMEKELAKKRAAIAEADKAEEAENAAVAEKTEADVEATVEKVEEGEKSIENPPAEENDKE